MEDEQPWMKDNGRPERGGGHGGWMLFNWIEWN